MSWYSPMPPHPYTRRYSSLWPRLVDMTATAAVVTPQNGRRHRPEISQSFFRLPPPDGEGDPIDSPRENPTLEGPESPLQSLNAKS